MCRLFALRASHPTRVEAPLLCEANSLVCQSRSDFEGRAHPDGWGLGWYERGQPQSMRSVLSAGDDPQFGPAVTALASQTILAHVRLASVGTVNLANTHPFTWGRWMLVHNGTVSRFSEVVPAIEADLAPDLKSARAGSTDSELVFLWILARLRAAGAAIDAPSGAACDPALLAQTVSQVIHDLVAATPVSGEERPTALNLLITDGQTLVASRWKRTLWWTRLQRPPAWQGGGAPAAQPPAGQPYWAVAIGSEPSTADHWTEVPDGGLLSVDAQGRTELHSPV